MATDDTGTAPRGECQIKGWGDRVDGERLQAVAPACVLADALELDTQASRIQGGGASASGILGLASDRARTVSNAALRRWRVPGIFGLP